MNEKNMRSSGVWRFALGSGHIGQESNVEQFEARVWDALRRGEKVEWVEFNGRRWGDQLLEILVDEIAYAAGGGEP